MLYLYEFHVKRLISVLCISRCQISHYIHIIKRSILKKHQKTTGWGLSFNYRSSSVATYYAIF
jgi:hypothetical protein